jgi:hypothetical protein
MNEASAHMEYLDELILRTETELFIRVQPYWYIVEHLSKNLPGISLLSAALIISEIGVDMTIFESDKHFASWAGLAPTNNESAGKKKSVRISRAGQYLKPLMIQCALAAVKSKKEPYFALKYQKLKKRRGHKKAIIAIARMMITCIFHKILTGEKFNPSDLADIYKPTAHKVILTDEVAIAYLAEHGYDVSSLEKQSSENISLENLALENPSLEQPVENPLELEKPSMDRITQKLSIEQPAQKPTVKQLLLKPIVEQLSETSPSMKKEPVRRSSNDITLSVESSVEQPTNKPASLERASVKHPLDKPPQLEKTSVKQSSGKSPPLEKSSVKQPLNKPPPEKSTLKQLLDSSSAKKKSQLLTLNMTFSKNK